ncbi:MAG: 1,4-dihydroxy-2-naphthoate polyprenyltransferase [Ekhidna sp.]
MANLKSWIVAARLRTLPLAFSSILVGTALVYNRGGINLAIFGLTLLTAIFLQILSNLANDYGDAVSGVDSADRDGPKRMVQSGAITKEAMKRGLIISSILTFVSGLGLLYLSFPENWKYALIFLVIGLVAIAAAIKYTMGKNPYGYAGFGDLFVFLFFGIVAVVGTYFLQTESINWLIFLPASALGLFAVGVLNVNNIRDIESDELSGKHSIPVRIGKEKAITYHSWLLNGAMVLTSAYVLLTYDSWWDLLFILVNPLLFKNINAVKTKPATELDPYLKQMALSTLLFAVLFAIGQFMS